jgi:hypothetical protein
MTITMIIPIGFSAPITFELNGPLNSSTSSLKPCSIVFQSAGENVASSSPQCTDTNIARKTYTSSMNSSDFDQLSYDYGVMANMGTRSTTYSSTVNTLV